MAFLNRYFYFAILLVLLSGLNPSVRAEETIQLYEQDLKAGLLYNFLKYTTWPENIPENSPIRICLIGNDPFFKHLEPMSERTVNQHSIEVVEINKIDEADKCQLLFVSGTQRGSWPQFYRSLNGKSILTVSDFNDFATTGGMIEFLRKDNRIVAQLNMEALNKANLKVQDRLLKLVTVIGKR